MASETELYECSALLKQCCQTIALVGAKIERMIETSTSEDGGEWVETMGGKRVYVGPTEDPA